MNKKWRSVFEIESDLPERFCSVCGNSWFGHAGIFNKETDEYVCNDCERRISDDALNLLADDYQEEFEAYFDEVFSRDKKI